MDKKEGHIFILIGPTCSGKTTLIKKIVKKTPKINTPVIDTTREKRHGESGSNEYNYINFDDFNSSNYLFSYKCHGFCYGLPHSIKKEINNGNSVILGLSRNLIKPFKEMFKFVSVIYIHSDGEVIRQRLLLRNRDKNEEELQKRLNNAHEKFLWLQKQNVVDVVIHNNDDIKAAFEKLYDYVWGKI